MTMTTLNIFCNEQTRSPLRNRARELGLARKVSTLCLIVLLASGLNCTRSETAPGLYSGAFSWHDGLTGANLALESGPHRSLDVQNKDVRQQIESIVRGQIERANLRTAEGSMTVFVVGTQPLLISLKRIEILKPSFSELLAYVESENLSGIRQFVTAHNNPNQRDLPSQRTALFYAAAGSKVTAVQTLLALGSDPNLADFEGDTPLMATVTADCVEAARQLIVSGANVNQANQTGETPLIRAAELGRSRMLSLLLREGANPNYASPEGRSALTLARERRDKAAISLLERSGALK
jgi:hypothetical protein